MQIRVFGGKVLNTELLFIIINISRLFLKSFRELPCQFASVSRNQKEWLLLVISVIYLLSAKPQKLLWRHSILNAHCNHITFLFEKVFKAEGACRVTAFVSEIFNLCIIGFYCLYMLRPELDPRPKLTPTNSEIPC